MFDIGASELLLIMIVAILVIGPKDMPLALRTAGRWIGKIRRVSSHFRTGIDAMIREAEMEEMDRKWREQNEAIMAKYPTDPGIAADEEAVPFMEPLPSDAISAEVVQPAQDEAGPSQPADNAAKGD